MPSVLIGHSFFLRFDTKQWERARPYPPLATLQVAELVRRQGHAVRLFDAMLAEGPQDFERQLQAQPPQCVLLYEDNYNYLSKMCLARMRDAACTMIGLAKASGARVLVAGSDVSDAPEVYLRAGADAALRGEGLDVLPALLARLDADPELPSADLVEGLPGAVGWREGRPVATQALVAPMLRAKASEAVEVDLPAAWDLVDIEAYRAVWRPAHGVFSLNMAASKGCSFRCNWCAKPIWGQRYLQRSPESVAAEMVRLKTQFGIEHVWFADDVFGFRADWVQRLATALQALGGGVPFDIQIRADLISPAMARALAEAGCREAWIGAESGSQQVLDAMHKGTTVEEIHEARRRLGAAGVRVGFFIQLGYLGEGLAELLMTRRLIEEAAPDAIGVSVAYPLPGTRFHEQVREQLGAQTHWRESADLAMMFQGSFGTAFYREVRDLLHAQVEQGDSRALRQRWQALIEQAQPAVAALTP